jgi:hypothetical protein
LGQVTHVILTRSRLCPGPKPGSSLHLHVLSTPPAFVLSQDQTLRKKCDVTGVSHKRVVMSLTRRRVHNAATDMTELSTPARCMMGRGRARATKDAWSLVARCSVFKDHSGGSTGLVASALRSAHKKGPSFEGARREATASRPILGSSLRGGSLRGPKQERPESIALERPRCSRISACDEAQKSTLPHLQDLPAQLPRRQVQPLSIQRLPIQLHGPLTEQPARLAGAHLERR